MALTSLRFLERFISLPDAIETIVVNGRSFSRSTWNIPLLSDLLTRQGVEVEGIVHYGAGLDTVIVGRVESVVPHPNADKLRVCQVNVGGESTLSIVCGAPNVRENLYVAVALVDTELSAVNLIIKSAKIRGVESSGMLCSRQELGLPVVESWDGDGIWELHVPAQGGVSEEVLASRLGEPIFDVLGLRDVLLELNILANRPDLRCHFGIARELAAGFQQLGLPFSWRSESMPAMFEERSIVSDVLRSTIVDCGDGAFSVENELGVSAFFVVIDQVEARPSPAWLRNLLEGLGQNSINQVVDASNFILLAYGQPSHAFDLDKLAKDSQGNRKLFLRLARADEKFVGLDGKERLLSHEDCVVADVEKPQALLGVIGGDESKVDGSTRRIVLEFANPYAIAVRRSSRRHNRSTESSVVFEKGIDAAWRWRAAHQILACLVDWTPGATLRYVGSLHSRLKPRTGPARAVVPDSEVAQTLGPSQAEGVCVDFSVFASDATLGSAASDVWRSFAEERQRSMTIFLPDHAVEKMAGTNLLPESDPRGERILTALGFLCTQKEGGLEVVVPSWRWRDVREVPDVVEEILRINGIDAIPAQPLPSLLNVVRDDEHMACFESVGNAAATLGYHEVAGLHFMRDDDLSRLGLLNERALGTPLRLLNPIISDEPLMHTTLVPDLLRKVARNLAYGTRDGQMFHLCRTFQNHNVHGDVLFGNAACTNNSLFEYDPHLGFSYSHESNKESRPTESPRIAGVVFGSRVSKSWLNAEALPWDLHTVLAHAVELGRAAGVVVAVQPLDDSHPFAPALHPGRRAALVAMDKQGVSTPVGWAGVFHPSALRNFEIDGVCVGFELSLSALWRLRLQQDLTKSRTPIRTRRFPAVTRDFSVVLDEAVTGGILQETVTHALNKGLSDIPAELTVVRIFDIFRGKGVSVGKKSVAFTVHLEPQERTLTDSEIQKVCRVVVDEVAERLGGELRGG